MEERGATRAGCKTSDEAGARTEIQAAHERKIF